MTENIAPTPSPPFIVWLTGASGVGKTTALRVMEARLAHTSWIFLHLDGIDRPAVEDMAAQVGALSNEQDVATHWWIRKAATEYPTAEVVVVDAQSDLNFVEDACRHCGVANYAIILLDCDWEIISDRLIHQRRQPHLASERMHNWVRYLRRQAQEKNALIIDTSTRPPDRVVDMILAHIPAR
jgi:RNase adaptor protein for sRNA GlmZ degradation